MSWQASYLVNNDTEYDLIITAHLLERLYEVWEDTLFYLQRVPKNYMIVTLQKHRKQYQIQQKDKDRFGITFEHLLTEYSDF